MKTLSFFGKEGLTSTSANHVANLAKEYVRNAHERLAAIKFYTEKVGLLTSNNEAIVSNGMNADDVKLIPEIVKLISDANSLIAFLREAIKEKERKMKEAQSYRDEEAWNKWGEDSDTHQMNRPVKQDYPTIEDIKQKWSVGQQEKYLSLEAEAAALGKLIHPDGYLSEARIDLMQKIHKPSYVQLNGSETIVHKYEQTVSLSDVNDVFNSLQAHYREIQAELNGMKKAIDDEIFTQSQLIDNAYSLQMQEYDDETKRLQIIKHRIEDEDRSKRSQMLVDARDLKIVIPNRLKPIYDLVQGK